MIGHRESPGFARLSPSIGFQMSLQLSSSRCGPMAAATLSKLALPILVLAGATSSCALVDQDFQRSEGEPFVGEGGRVIGLSGSYSYRETDIGESESFAARATIDQFLTDEHAVGAYALGQFSNVESDSDGKEELWLGVHYHYQVHLSERTSLYAGPSLGVAFFDDETRNDGSLTYGLSGGVRHWLTERAAFTLEPTYLRANFDADAGNDSEDFLVLWGLAFSL